MAGHFIVLEGPDGGGTTRQSAFLAENLRQRGEDVVLTAEPTDGKIGRDIRQILSTKPLPPADALQLLFCADRAEHVANVILPALEAGQTVISDRYALSTIVYGGALGVDTSWLEEINRHFPTPDLTLLTLPPFEICCERIAKRSAQDEFEATDFQRKVYDAYAAIDLPGVIHIDTTDAKHQVAARILQHVDRHFGEVSRSQIAGL